MRFRTLPEDLLGLRVRSGDANALPEPRAGQAAAAGAPARAGTHRPFTVRDKTIYHKNLMPVTYVIGDVAGAIESPVYAILQDERGDLAEHRCDVSSEPTTAEHQGAQCRAAVFSDLTSRRLNGMVSGTLPSRYFATSGMAFAAVLVLIYILDGRLVRVVPHAR